MRWHWVPAALLALAAHADARAAPATSCPGLASSVEDGPDSVTLADGRVLRGRVLSEDDECVVVLIDGRERTLARREVTLVQSLEGSLRELFTEYAALARLGAGGLAPLATFCKANGLAGEARVLWWRVLLADDAHERAWIELGGARTTRGWRFVTDGRHLTLDERLARTNAGRAPLELTTTHFELSAVAPTRAALRDALDLALNLERAYVAYDAFIGRELGLRPFAHSPRVRLHGRREDFPTPPVPGERAWFDRAENTLHLDASRPGFEREAWTELGRLLLHNTFPIVLGDEGVSPAWLERGLATHFAASVTVADGVARWTFGPPWPEAFLQAARDPAPLSLSRVVAAGDAAFQRGTDASAHVVHAYTLVHFLLHGDGGALRKGLLAYARDAPRGQGALGHLEHAVGLGGDALERRWRVHVSAQAGR